MAFFKFLLQQIVFITTTFYEALRRRPLNCGPPQTAVTRVIYLHTADTDLKDNWKEWKKWLKWSHKRKNRCMMGYGDAVSFQKHRVDLEFEQWLWPFSEKRIFKATLQQCLKLRHRHFSILTLKGHQSDWILFTQCLWGRWVCQHVHSKNKPVWESTWMT